MSELVHIRQRIKIIETIEKITHAMRLISMSTHSRLKNKQEYVLGYKKEVAALLQKLYPFIQDKDHPLFSPPTPSSQHPSLIILVGSQRGLCGNFNTVLFHIFEQHIKQQNKQYIVIAVGKKAEEFIEKKYPHLVLHSYNDFTTRSLFTIAKKIATTVLHPQIPYSSVIILSNVVKRFFVQQPQLSRLIPFSQELLSPHIEQETDYIWEYSPNELFSLLLEQYIETNIEYFLLQSLLAEHAARFISMDNATQNARSLLEATKLQYNKLRQTKITKELIELTGNI